MGHEPPEAGGNSGPAGRARSRSRVCLGRRDLVFFGGRRLEHRLRQLRPRGLPQLRVRRPRFRAARSGPVPAQTHGQVPGRARFGGLSDRRGMHANLRAIGRARCLRQRPPGWLCRQSRAVTLTAVPAASQPRRTRAAAAARWSRFRDVFSRTKGIPVIAAFVLGVSWILVFMQQGQDLVRGVGEDNFWQYPSGLLQIAFAVGLLFLAIQAWSWSRIVIDSNYGADRAIGGREMVLIWTPRVLGALPFVATAMGAGHESGHQHLVRFGADRRSA